MGLLVLALLCLLPLRAHAQEFPQLTGRVVDAAELLNAEQEAQLTQLSQEIETASSRQFVVATIPDLQGYDIADYGYRLGRDWGIGQEGANNGILLIVAPNDREVRIEVGYGLEPVMTDALSSIIIREDILPRFRDGDMAGGILAGAQAIGEQMKLPLEAAEVRAKERVDAERASGGGDEEAPRLLLIVFWCGVMAVIFVVIAASSGGGGGGGGGRRRYRRGAAPVILWGPGWGSGGHHGGGSSWGGSSGGFGGGGGFGGFSGGGGSFGGGGASGSW